MATLKFLCAITLMGMAVAACNTRPPEMDAEARPRRTIGVNAHLWRAAQDTLRFLPNLKSDPYGGIIISDWYFPTADKSERIKLTVHIADQLLVPQAIAVTVFRQVRTGADWQTAATDPNTARQLEDRILTRALALARAAPSSS